METTIETQEPAGFYKSTKELLNQGFSEHDAVAALIGRPEFRDSIISIVATHVRSAVSRDIVRTAERVASSDMARQEIRSAKASLNLHSFPLPDGRFVEWVKATAEDHRQRADWFRTQIGALTRTMQLHELVATLIEEAGATCLAEIESVERWPQELAAFVGTQS